MSDNALCQCNGSTARRVFLLRVMNFVNGYIIGWELIDHPRKVFIEFKKEVDTEAVIRCVKKCRSLLTCEVLDFLTAIQPPGCSAYGGDPALNTFLYILIGCIGMGEFDCYIRFYRIQILCVVNVNLARDAVAAFKCYAFDGLAHFTITYQQNIHAAIFCGKVQLIPSF